MNLEMNKKVVRALADQSVGLFSFFSVLALCLIISLQAPENRRAAGVASLQLRVSAETAERDEIGMLLAYSLVLKDWQKKEPGRRGYNIGCVLLNADGRIVSWGRNSNHVTGNGSQHAEVRAMESYLDHRTFGEAVVSNSWVQFPAAVSQTRTNYDLRGFTVYTTVESCAMCAGMMTLLRVKKVVFGQRDETFGAGLERLQFDSRRLHGGMPPYPGTVRSVPSRLDFRQSLEEGFLRMKEERRKADPKAEAFFITDFLHSDAARAVFEQASSRLLNFQAKSPANQRFLSEALRFLKETPDHYIPLHLHL